MAASYPVRSFALGELTKRLGGRVDSPFYAQGCATMENSFANAIGDAEKRPGTLYVNTTKTSGKIVVLVSWKISPTEGRILEFGDLYIRYYKDGARIGTVETTTTFAEADLLKLRFCQISSYMYIVHPSYAPSKLTRTDDTTWALSTPSFTAGAGEENFTGTGHYPSHVEMYEDRLIFARTNLKPATFWGSRVASYEDFSLRRSASVTTPLASPGIVTWTNHGLIANSAVVFSGGTLPTGITANVTYYVLGQTITTNTFQISATPAGAAINFTGTNTPPHTGYAAITLATDAWEKTPRAKENAEILWIVAEDALLFGTSDGAFRVGGKENILTGDAAWWPTRQSSVGSDDSQALLVDDFVAFVGKAGKHIYRFQYSEPSDKYVAEDIAMLSEHLLGTGASILAHQREPKTILWAITTDGKLLSGSYNKAAGIIGWSKHDLAGTAESIAVIPTAGEDEVYVLVKRTINGATVRHIEYFADREWSEVKYYHGVDDGMIWNGLAPVAVTSITAANPAVCTTPVAHGFSNDWKVRFKDVTGNTGVNGSVYTVKSVSTYTFQLYTEDGSTAIDFSAEAAGAGGTVERVTNVVTGLTHLEGEDVIALGDGSTITCTTVASGSSTLSEYANYIHIGLPFASEVEPMPISEAKNRLKRVNKVYAEFYNTADAQISDGVSTPRQITFDGEPDMDVPPGVFSDGVKELFDGYADYKGRVVIRSENPLPQTILCLTYEVVTGS